MTLEIITARALGPIRHGFFTRRGGASSGVFEGLNCGVGSSDQSDMVRINRARAAEAMGVAPDRLVTLHQVHSSDAVTLTAPPDGPLRADAMATAAPGLALGILTADCQPVLFADAATGVVGAAHAGWKGALDGVLEATLDAMERLGAHRERVGAAVGPTISQRAYEVGPEFLERFIDEDPAFSRFFVNGREDRCLFDLPGFVLDRLRTAGVDEAGWIGACTYADPERYFSFRRATHAGESDYGRLISAIVL
jgi:YfiH family protein